MGENASETRACFNPCASFVTITQSRFFAVRCFLIAALTSSTVSFCSASRMYFVNSGMPYHFESSA